MKSRMGLLISLIFMVSIAFGIFQNCARAKFVDPDTNHSSFALGLCAHCGDDSGRGVNCRSNTNSAFSACVYESCNPGFLLQNRQCVPVVCTPGSIANCAVEHGEGRMACLGDQNRYGACEAISCAPGFILENNSCVAVASLACQPGSHRDCSTESTLGVETCNDAGSGYGACQFDDCKAGFNKDNGDTCVPNLCEPNTMTPCTVGAGVGFKSCNSIGSSWGACELNGCQPGYILKDGVCTIQVCQPGEESVCEFHNGSGVKTCNSEGTDYGACVLRGCQHGYGVENGKCLEHTCVPSSQATCQGESGSGIKYCYQNGRGFGPCTLTACDPGFKLKNGQCVINESCEAGETLVCSEQNGSGLRTCNTNSNRFGPCELNDCNPEYELVQQGGSKACKKTK